MKYMNKFMTSILFLVLASVQVFGQATEATFTVGGTGTTSATAFVPTASSAAEIRDLAVRTDTGVTTATVDIRTAKSRYPITSATAASTSVLYFSNTGSAIVTIGDYVIFEDASVTTPSYYLFRAKSVTSTSITVQETITVAAAITDNIYPLNAAVRRPQQPVNSPTANNRVSIWLPAGLPSALTVDGNTTSCSIAVSGVRGNSK